MLSKNTMLSFVILIFNLHLIRGESEEFELPKIDYGYISSADSETNIGDENSIMVALNAISNKMQDNEKTLAKKLEQLENNLNNKIKEAIDSAIRQATMVQAITNDIAIRQTIQTITNKNNNEMQNMIEKVLTTKLEQLENRLDDKIKEVNDSAIRHTTMIQTIANESAIRQTSIIQTIANLTNVVQTMSRNLTELENRTLECHIQLENCTAQNKNKGNETNCVSRCKSECGSESRLLHVSVPSEVHARDDVWKNKQIPAMDDLDVYMVNVTGCRYMAREYTGSFNFLSSSSAGGRWRRTLAVRGEGDAYIRVTWGTTHDYRFYIGYNSNTQTVVYDARRGTLVLQRATPGVMSRERYTQFYYLQLEDGGLSFGAVGESEPWWRDHVTVADTDAVLMEYWPWTDYGGKLLVCS